MRILVLLCILLVGSGTSAVSENSKTKWNWVYTAPSRVTTFGDNPRATIVVRFGEASFIFVGNEIVAQMTDRNEPQLQIHLRGVRANNGDVQGILSGFRYDRNVEESWAGAHRVRRQTQTQEQLDADCRYEELIFRPVASKDGEILPNGSVLIFVKQQLSAVCD